MWWIILCGLYSKSVTCSNFVKDVYLYKFGALVPKLNNIMFLDCESYQLGKYHYMPYLGRVNKIADNPFALVHLHI